MVCACLRGGRLNIIMANVLVHKHLLIRAEVNKPLVNRNRTIKFLRKLIKAIDMKAMYGPTASYCKMPGNRGVTAFAIIETSHIAMHIWDEPKPALMQFDVYSCGEFDVKDICNKIKEEFDVKKIEYKYLNRETGLVDI